MSRGVSASSQEVHARGAQGCLVQGGVSKFEVESEGVDCHWRRPVQGRGGERRTGSGTRKADEEEGLVNGSGWIVSAGVY
jgi:hypothetical protein